MEIALREVGFSTGDTEILRSVSCRIESGQVVLVMGPSGSGKTLLMKIMATILPPGSGAVLYNQEPIDAMSDADLDRLRIRQGFVFQDSALWQNLSVYNNLALPTQYHFPRRPASEIADRVRVLCRNMGFTEDLSQRPARLSAGERKVASIIRALMMDPELLFMDEPSGGLDAGTSDRLLNTLKDLKRRGRTMVIASHDSEIASQLADWILVIDDGSILAYDRVSNLVRTSDHRVREILVDVFDLSSTYDTDILDILGSSDDPFS